MRRGQINIEFLAGALLFFGALIFTITTTLSAIPAFTTQGVADNLQTRGNSVAQFILTEPGHWNNGSASGADWEHHAEDMVRFGLADEPFVLNEGKIAALQENINDPTTLNYSEVKTALNTSLDFEISRIREYAVVKTFDQYNQSDGAPAKIIEPSTIGTFGEVVHYGYKTIDGVNVYALVLQDTASQAYQHIYLTQDPWNFTAATTYDTRGGDMPYVINGTQYLLRTGLVGSEESEGNLFTFTRDLVTNFGPTPPFEEETTIVLTDYGVVNGNLAKIQIEVWSE